MKIYELDSIASLSELSEENIIYDFYANWCGPCKNLTKSINLLSNESSFEDLALVKINVDKYSEIAQKHNVRSLPTLVFTKSGKTIKTKIGVLSKSDLTFMIKETYDV